MPQYKPHMFTIHEKYKNELKPQNLFVTNQIVIDYVNNLQASLLMHCLNYNYNLHNATPPPSSESKSTE